MNRPILSLCIPRIETTVTTNSIMKTFSNLNLGEIEKIKELPLRNDNKHKRVLITLITNDTADSLFMKDLIEKNETVKIVYDMPWYWKVQSTRT